MLVRTGGGSLDREGTGLRRRRRGKLRPRKPEGSGRPRGPRTPEPERAADDWADSECEQTPPDSRQATSEPEEHRQVDDATEREPNGKQGDAKEHSPNEGFGEGFTVPIDKSCGYERATEPVSGRSRSTGWTRPDLPGRPMARGSPSSRRPEPLSSQTRAARRTWTTTGGRQALSKVVPPA